jgi:protein-L-isoaspartate(D-aspartate) O-methyltransferase
MNEQIERQQLVQQLVERGITDARVLDAMSRVPRERFVPPELRDQAYDDCALPIGEGQTISQPYMVALMTQELALEGTETVLEIGTGSGYQGAILAELCRHVVTIERLAPLSEAARRLFDELGYTNITCRVGDGSLGWDAEAPYDRIMVTAGAPDIPAELYRQLRMGGRLVIPIGSARHEMLSVVDKTETGPRVVEVCDCTFVPLIGAGGWHEDPRRGPEE